MEIVQEFIAGNFWAGRAGHAVEAVCFHVAEGGRAGVKAWFNDPKSQASAHYLINKDGSIWQFVRESDTAWANGVVCSPNMADPLIAGWVRSGINPNRVTISVETERWRQERLTPQQLAACGELSAAIHRRYRLPVDGSRLIGHGEIDSVNRGRCPSFSDQEWTAIIAATRAGGVEIDPEQPADDDSEDRVRAFYAALPAALRGVGDQVFHADFSSVAGAPAQAGVGVRGEYVTLWAAQGHPVRAMQPQLFDALSKRGAISILA